MAINARRAGHGPPVLLLHGYPQTHTIWHRVAGRLAERFTVVLADLRGYGDSDKPESSPDHAPYSKRAMARDQAGVMRVLGFDLQWPFDPAAFAEYLRCFRRPATIHASCVEGRPLASGHYLPEEVPAETVAELLRFLA